MHSRGRLIFYTGGARSGKSGLAQARIEREPGGLLYIATAEARDEEMKRRIRLHQEARGERWTALECPLDLAGALSQAENYGGVLVDCLTLWTSNLMEAHHSDQGLILSKVDGFLAEVKRCRATVAVVTNEVGMGIVPENALAREFRDLAGLINRKVSLAADEAYLAVAGRVLTLAQQ